MADRPGPAPGDEQLSRLEEQLFDLAQGPGSRTAERRQPEAGRPRHMVVAGQSLISGFGPRRLALTLLAAGVGSFVWWWASGARTAPVQPTPPAVAGGAAAALGPEATEQLQSMARELGALRRSIDQLKADQERATSTNQALAQQVRQNQEQLAMTGTSLAELSRTRDSPARGLEDLAERVRSIQAQISRESELTSERLKVNEDQIRRAIAVRAPPSPRVLSSAAPQQAASTAPPKPAPVSAPKGASPPPKKPQLSSAPRPTPAR
ncbi:hypothetical protein FBZ96_10497 [Bradyrhizobium stylosanthis]|uniref:Uncharacterized protein n=1 Tax=Bradyrhizobium stylosanthis TaxID=1803665 RepID=A0A560DPT0_9BRAD|nr:hypothetical protein FBZ96_10497 [Bradyrhizobium stylosanthis]